MENIKVEKVMIKGFDLFNNRCYCTYILNGKEKTKNLPISEFEFCLLNGGAENGVLLGDFEIVDYLNTRTLLHVNSPKYIKAMTLIEKKSKNKK